jgi:hypothetical protein
MKAPTSQKDLPFKTGNAILAYCLHMAGVPWHDYDNPIKVIYSAEILNGFTNGSGEPIYKGWELKAAVKDAHEKGLRGHITYIFRKTPRLDMLLRAYSNQVDQLESAEGAAHELVQKVSQGLGSSGWDITMVRLACIFLKMRVPFMEKWQDMIPWIMIPNQGQTTRRRGVMDTRHGMREAILETGPGWKMIPINASKELLEKFGLN